MTKDEALKLALEALDNLMYWDNGKPEYDEARDAITAIKEALAQSEQLYEENERLHVENRRLIDRIETIGVPVGVGGFLTTTASPEQKPVAVKHMMEWIEYLKRKSDYGQHMQIPSEMSAGACWELAIELEQFINTIPPQRTWTGLTDEEIDAVTDSQWVKGVNKPIYAAHRAYARAIEAAHGIKENT